jgi:hypothetical protein
MKKILTLLSVFTFDMPVQAGLKNIIPKKARAIATATIAAIIALPAKQDYCIGGLFKDLGKNNSFLTTAEQDIEESVIRTHFLHPEKSIEEIRQRLALRISEIKAITLEDIRLAPAIFSEKEMQGIQDSYNIFNILKKYMNIPDEVELRIGGSNVDSVACYHIFQRSVIISGYFIHMPPSQKIFLLIHELTHCQQHIHDGWEALNKPVPRIEWQADHQAASAIKCPTCMKEVAENTVRSEETLKKGYLSQAQLLVHAQYKRQEDLCCVHKPKNNFMKALGLTKNSDKASIIDQLSTVQFDYPPSKK